MARTKTDNVEEEPEIELSDEEMEDIEEEMDEQKEDSAEDQHELSEELQELYGSPEPEELHSAHTILNKAMFKEKDTIRTTFLTEPELGRPLFSVRFNLELYKDAVHHNLPILKEYYWNKVQNITGSGLSNKGFGLNVAVTHKRDMTRRRIREDLSDQKGGAR